MPEYLGFVQITPADSYPVFLADRPLVGDEGEALGWLVDHNIPAIRISPDLDESGRDRAVNVAANHARQSYPSQVASLPFWGDVA